MCEYCELDKDNECKACGDMWLSFGIMKGWRLYAPMGQSEVFYCPWCGQELENPYET